jgi:hypothetical protein
MALLWPLTAWSVWSHPATVVAETTGKGNALACIRLIVVGSVNVVAGR